jgi:hypothetical protein
MLVGISYKDCIILVEIYVFCIEMKLHKRKLFRLNLGPFSVCLIVYETRITRTHWRYAISSLEWLSYFLVFSEVSLNK